MKKTFSQSKDEIAQLCKYFARNHQEFLAPGVKEAHVRSILIDPLFEALGWDVRNTDKVAPQYREVMIEDSLDVEGHQKAPDYSFRIGTMPKFYAEAKKCGININADPGPAYQLRRYGWSAKVSLSVLTDFEELSIYDCTKRPTPKDKASYSRMQYYHFEQYPDHWREIWDVFSREAVWSGAFDKYTASKRKRGTSEVDTEFLKEIEGWRDVLARNIALRNKDLSSDDLNAAVQRTIDRIVFLRMAEDRGIEPYEQLLKLCERPEIYPRFMRNICTKADQKYNSGLFHFQKEQGISEAPDQITPRLKVDDKAIKPILQNLYFSHGSPYHFGVLPVEILGTVYERFLGKVIRLTAGHQAKIEEKPEVRKAGGVYYTPSYIVDYIVEHTVGVQIKDKSPSQLTRGKNKEPFRVLDMACGSGSFLLGAYKYLLDHCLKWYIDHNPSRHKKAVFKDERNGQWRLTIIKKKQILKTHIFGVDIDPQAVEVSKLSLLLKVLEGETDQTIGQQMQLFQERTLPNLSDNIKCGNSLIGPEYFENKLLLDEDEMRRVQPFDWESEFPDIFAAGGFDCVIGNPPWLMAGYYVADGLEYLRKKYKSAKGKFDLYYLFVEKGCRVVSDRGLFGMILPNKLFHTKAASSLRDILSEHKWIRGIVDFGDEQIFSGATNYSCILFLQKKAGPNPEYIRAKARLIISQKFKVPWSIFSSDTWHFEDKHTRNLFSKMDGVGVPLEQITTRFGTGVQSGADRILTVDHDTARNHDLENEILRTILRGRDVRRYAVSSDSKLLLFPYNIKDDEYVIMMEEELSKYENMHTWLISNKKKLAKRVWFGKTAEELSGKWYGMVYLDANSSFTTSHILTPSLSNCSNFALGTGDLFVTGTAGVTSIIPEKEMKENILYLLGILNSKLLSFYAIGHSPVFSGGYYKFSAPYLKKLCIRRIKFDNRTDAIKHDKIVALVKHLLELHKRLANVSSAADKKLFLRQIDSSDKQIDLLVYDLYGLTEDDIAIVEGG